MRKITILLILLFSLTLTYGQSAWTKTDENKIGLLEKVNRKTVPTSYQLFHLDLEKFKQELKGAPIRGVFSGRSKHLIYLPNAEGNLERFYVMETPIMEEELAKNFSMIKSYAAQGIDDPSAVARFSVTPFGLHNMTLIPGKSTLYIDPYTENRANYLVYSRSAISNTAQDFACLLDQNVSFPSLENATLSENTVNAADDSKLRTYRLALSCTGEYGALFAGNGTDTQKKANIQAQMAITMTRVNGVYERDLAITMIFVANNNLLLYYNASTDPWTGEYNTKTAQTIDAAIGRANYDIGHNFNTSGGGNAGCIGCVCSTTTSASSSTHKGRGYTGLPNPTGDAFDIDYVAHEMGHQFGGFHTQSSSSCFSGSGSTEVEPGSGSTIMGYAGICAPNVQFGSDAYFHYVNIRDITANVKSGVSSSCPTIIPFSNNAPVITPIKDYIIPMSTPFVLTGSATDADGDVLNYTWEQNDPESSNLANTATPTAFKTSGPVFRSIEGSTKSFRFFPNKNTILAGQTSNTWEVLPAVSRVLNFALTVRDNVAGGAQTATDEMKVTVSNLSGPFIITSQNTTVSYPAGSNQTITWEVASTDQAPVNARFVDIYLSTDNGSSFPILLASKVPNDGSEIVTIPNSIGNNNRIMVRGFDSIFFDISNTTFAITDPLDYFALSFSGIEGEQNKSVCKTGSLTFSMPFSIFDGTLAPVTFTALNLPAGMTATFTPEQATLNSNVVLTLTTSNLIIPDLYKITVQATSGSTVKIVNIYTDILNNQFSEINLISPINGTTVSPDNVIFNWSDSNGATLYQIQIATDPNFNTIIEENTVATPSYVSTTLANVKNFFWRILPKNEGCFGTFSNASNFSTIFCGTMVSINVPVTIPTSVSTVNSTLTVSNNESVFINQMSVQLDISHSYVGDMNVKLKSPSGTEVILFANNCSSGDNVNATFDDQGTVLVCGTNPAISGSLLPAQSLSAFSGQISEGIWTLSVTDSFNQDGGIINNWGINFCSTAVPLDISKNTWSEFIVHPNPNKGNFNVKLKNNSSDRIVLSVYDLSGRIVFNKNYPSAIDFNENIQLENIQAGIYMLTVFDGDLTQVKRIIVQ